ncbi:MAG: hydrogenase formation protein HypD [Bacteroidetes bacterium]|jgi:hydrogenase expression/formation protein HypD|nr:hydrogenase formation protein HypD [Bacteroidota bacterium]MBT6686371.1 hydrogenase formation protein HypD [Bacteroidota bacterium]MBT7142204.1 hydrogenase formation protein HypD [Bacteroidota bacterium]MBT7490441.1 hydrogenase formation protein HypD [Bacteroidota bacterium]
MKYIDEYRNKELVLKIVNKIKSISKKEVSLMEVCGGHTMSIQKFGIPSLLPKNIKLMSGPGCPVCVSSRKFIDQAIAYSRLDDVIITTYGDLIRVPGSSSSLDLEKAKGQDIRIVYSVLDALKIAQQNPSKKIIFLGIGFETTAPSSAAGILNAERQKIDNFYLFSSHKIMPPAMAALIDEGVKIDGYIAPGHVSTITGSGIYTDVAEKYNLACVISGFEPVDLLQSIYMLVKQIEENNFSVEIQYKRVVKPEGNLIAQKMLDTVFELRDEWWRGLGVLPDSGYFLKEKYSKFDAEKMLEVEVEPTLEEKGCICGEILKGLKVPKDCKLFAKACTPNNPYGACMVSSEGACNAYYKYNRN